MRWLPFVILAFVVLVLQSSLGALVVFDVPWFGLVAPDALAIIGLFIAMSCSDRTDALIAGWVLGFCLDLTVVGGVPTLAVLGPMSLGYVAAVWVIYSIREMIFGSRVGPQVVLACLFVLIAHGVWLVCQSVLAWSWVGFGQSLRQMMGVMFFTGLLMPLGYRLLMPLQMMIMETPIRAGRQTRGKR
jgi:hypothetical protein